MDFRFWKIHYVSTILNALNLFGKGGVYRCANHEDMGVGEVELLSFLISPLKSKFHAPAAFLPWKYF